MSTDKKITKNNVVAQKFRLCAPQEFLRTGNDWCALTSRDLSP